MIRRRIACMLAFVCLLVGGDSRPGGAAEQKLLLVVLDKVSWYDLMSDDVQAPMLRRLAEEGAVGLMCVRSARGHGGEYLTIGAGSRAASRLDPVTRTNAEADAYQAGEVVRGRTAAEVYTARTGWRPAGDAILHLSIGELVRQNASADYPLRLGLLGRALRRAGVRVACVGNADTPAGPHRELVAIGMDEQGRVPLGDVSRRLAVRDPTCASGATFSESALLRALRRAAETADLVVLDPGETSRVESYAAKMTSEAAQAERHRAIEQTDRLIAQALSPRSAQQWSALILAPSLREPQAGESEVGLAPVILWSPGQEPGILSSRSTGRPGLVVNTDVAPTVLRYFGIEPSAEAVGRPMTVDQVEGSALERLGGELARHAASERARRQVFRTLPAVATIALWVSAFFLLVGERVPRRLRILIRGVLLLLLSVPAGMLLAAVPALPADQILLVGMAAACVVALVGAWTTGWRLGHVLPCLLLVGLLVYDLVRGQEMLYWSPLSYSASAGARFYGIGNEYAGALLGASLIGAASILWPRDKVGSGERIFATGCLLAVAVLVGVPRFGANLGMSLGMAVGAGVFALYLGREAMGWPKALLGLLLATAIVAAAVAVDVLLRGVEASHIGRWVVSVKNEGWQAVYDVLARKLAMNWLLIRVSSWTGVAAAALGVLGVSVAARPSRVVAVLRERAWLSPALIACVAASAAALVLNDSGIVAASLALLYAAGALAYLALGDVGLEQ
jgi:hypothetical protein